MASILITGSNRGLGLEWVRQFADKGWRVYATCRYPEQADELRNLASCNHEVTVHCLDVTNPQQISALAFELRDKYIDVLVNNAGVYHEQWGQDPLGNIDYQKWQHTFDVNSLGPMRVSEALIKQIANNDRHLIVSVTSHMGSITDITSANDYAYRSSKAALNAAMRGLSIEVAELGIGVLLVHPGWVRTRMGGESAPLSVRESVSGMSNVLEKFNKSQSAHFIRYDGSIIPWQFLILW